MDLFADAGHSSAGVAAAAWSAGDRWAVSAWRCGDDESSGAVELRAVLDVLGAFGGDGHVLHVDHDMLLPAPGRTFEDRRDTLRRRYTRYPVLLAELYEAVFAELIERRVRLVQVAGHDHSTPAGLVLCDRLERWARWQLRQDPDRVRFDVDDSTAAGHGLTVEMLEGWDRKDFQVRQGRRAI